MKHVIFLAGPNNYDVFEPLLKSKKDMCILVSNGIIERDPRVKDIARKMNHSIVYYKEWKTIEESIIYICFPVLHFGLHVGYSRRTSHEELKQVVIGLENKGNLICFIPEDIYMLKGVASIVGCTALVGASNKKAYQVLKDHNLNVFRYTDPRIRLPSKNFIGSSNSREVGVVIANKNPFSTWINTIKKVDTSLKEQNLIPSYRVFSKKHKSELKNKLEIDSEVGVLTHINTFLKDKEYVVSINSLSSYAKASSLGIPSLFFVDLERASVETLVLDYELISIANRYVYNKKELRKSYVDWVQTFFVSMPLDASFIEDRIELAHE